MHSHEHAFILYFDDGYGHAWLNTYFKVRIPITCLFDSNKPMFLPL